MTNRRRLSSAGLAIALSLLGLALPPQTRAAVVVNTKIPLVIGVVIPCAGEIALLSGNLHVLVTTEVDSNGGIHFKEHSQPQGISGVGLVTGDKYRGTGVAQEHFNIHTSLAIEDTFVSNFRIIGQGPGNNLLVHMTIHLTINANGDVTANVSNASVDCK